MNTLKWTSKSVNFLLSAVIFLRKSSCGFVCVEDNMNSTGSKNKFSLCLQEVLEPVESPVDIIFGVLFILQTLICVLENSVVLIILRYSGFASRSNKLFAYDVHFSKLIKSAIFKRKWFSSIIVVNPLPSRNLAVHLQKICQMTHIWAKFIRISAYLKLTK